MIRLIEVTKNFADFSLKNISLEIPPGEYFVVLGPSGAGKTLLLELLAGLLEPDKGRVEGIKPEKVALIYQDYMLFPHLNVQENIGYGLKLRKIPPQEQRAKLKKIATELEIEHLLQRAVTTLSGGEKFFSQKYFSLMSQQLPSTIEFGAKSSIYLPGFIVSTSRPLSMSLMISRKR